MCAPEQVEKEGRCGAARQEFTRRKLNNFVFHKKMELARCANSSVGTDKIAKFFIDIQRRVRVPYCQSKEGLEVFDGNVASAKLQRAGVFSFKYKKGQRRSQLTIGALRTPFLIRINYKEVVWVQLKRQAGQSSGSSPAS